MDEAANYALLAVYTSPYDLSAHELLKEIVQKAGDKQQMIERETRVIDMINKLQARIANEDRQAEKNAGR
jgi:hypothetical protein